MTQPQQNQADFDAMPLPPRDSRVHPALQPVAGLIVHKCPECGRVMAKCSQCESGKVEGKA